ncbi:MAG: hypothetical protein HC769_37515 [Cyanobacteria bacterium CRU_2_1]|nr:hypothetical protein [Cyanobacteria bacterium CRU_2_1]
MNALLWSIVKQAICFRKSAFLVSLPLLLFMSGCGRSVDLSTIRNFAILSNQAADQFPKIIADFHDSCVRAAQFSSTIEDRIADERDCDKLFDREFETKLNTLHDVLVSYLQLLAKLATGETTNFDPQLNDLTFAVNSGLTQGRITATPEQIKAANGILKFLFRAGTERYQQKKLKVAIQATNHDLKIVIEALKIFVNSDYARLLRTEEDVINLYYSKKLAQAKNDPALGLAIDREWREAKTALRIRKDATQSYTEILSQIAQAHDQLAQLYAEGEALDSPVVLQILSRYARTLVPLLEDVRKAF